MKVDISLRNVVICAPSNVDDNVLAIRGEFQIKLVEIWYLNSNGIKEYCESLEFHFLDTEENTDPRESEYFDIWIGDLI